MHLFTRAVGLKSFATRPAMDLLIEQLINKGIEENRVIYNPIAESQRGTMYETQINCPMLFENKKEIGGISIRGLYNPLTKEFVRNFYYPYIEGTCPCYNSELSLARQSDKEAYMVYCNEMKKEVAPIFFMRNIVEYLIICKGNNKLSDRIVFMSALALEGKIILPVHKSDEQIEKSKSATRKRNRLVNRAMQGDQDAIDSLTIGDYDILSNISRRIRKEDVYSIVDSSFIPSGLECDSYSVIGNIKEVSRVRNCITNEEIYILTLECNDIEFDLGIHCEDLYGIPEPGYRFVGKIWLQGSVFIDESDLAC